VNEKNIKYIAIGLGVFCIWTLFFRDSDQYKVNVQARVAAADGLDLKAIGPLLKKSNNAEEFEKLLNDPSTGINNLDLNEDDKVDYINVTEFGNDQSKGFSLTTALGSDDVQEIATIQIEKKGENADVQISGNQQIYGQNHHYHSRWTGLHSFLLMSYLFRPHPFYRSPWGWGYHPPYYRSYQRVSHSSYSQRISNTKSQSGLSKSSGNRMSSNLKSPNSGKSSSKVRAPLKNPSRSQKSFQSRNPSKRIRSGGFGRPSHASSRKSNFGGRRGGFGFGK